MQQPLNKVIFIQKVISFAPFPLAKFIKLAYVNQAWADTIKNYSFHLIEDRVRAADDEEIADDGLFRIRTGKFYKYNKDTWRGIFRRAFKYEMIWLVKALLTSRSFLDRTPDGCLILALGSESKSSAMFELLFDKIKEVGGIDKFTTLVKATDDDGDNCVMLTANRSTCTSPEVVELLIQKILDVVGGAELFKALITATNEDGLNYLMLVIRYSTSVEVLKLLFEKISQVGGAELFKTLITATSKNGSNCLMNATEHSKAPEVIKVLVQKIFEAGGDELFNSFVTATNNRGMNCIMLAAASSSPGVVKVILENVLQVGGSDLLKTLVTATDNFCQFLLYTGGSRKVMSPAVVKLFASLLFHFDLFTEQHAKLSSYDKKRLAEAGIKSSFFSSQWKPDASSVEELNKLLISGMQRKWNKEKAAMAKNIYEEYSSSLKDLSRAFFQTLQTLREDNDRKTAPLRQICTKNKILLPENVIQKLTSENVIETGEFELLDTSRLVDMNIGRDDRLKVLRLVKLHSAEAIVEMRTRYGELVVQHEETQRRLALNNELNSLQQEKVSLIMKLLDSQEKNKWLDSMNYSMNMNNATLDELQQAIDDLGNENADLAQIVGEQRSAFAHHQHIQHALNMTAPAVSTAGSGGDTQSMEQETVTSSEAVRIVQEARKIVQSRPEPSEVLTTNSTSTNETWS